MRHRVKINHLGRTSAHRKALLANLASSLIKQKRIETTIAKAKELRVYVEPLITRSKEDTTHSRRVVFSYLKDKEAVSELFREVSGKIATRPGGYTRILRTRSRSGDNADLCMIELVDFNENYAKAPSAGTGAKASTRRGRRGTKKKDTTEETTAPQPVSETEKETPAQPSETPQEPAKE